MTSHVHRWQSVRLLCAGLIMASTAGCGGSASNNADATQIVAQLSGLGDLSGMPERFNEVFAPGKAPADPARYGAYGYEAIGPVTVSGDTATVDVRIFGGVLSPAQGDKAKKASAAKEFTRTWTLQKIGDEWKLADAPLEAA